MIEYASLASLQRRVVDTNGCDHEASAELRRRGLAALTGHGRDPRELLRELERRKNPDYRSPRERLLWLHAHRGTTRNPYEAILQLHALRISQGW